MIERCPTCRKPWKRKVRKPRATTKEIREMVMTRAGGMCECGCGRALLYFGAAEMDHWLGGSGRRKQKESVETCWMLSGYCHHRRTRNEPSVAAWNERFERHCRLYDYPFTPHVEKKVA